MSIVFIGITRAVLVLSGLFAFSALTFLIVFVATA